LKHRYVNRSRGVIDRIVRLENLELQDYNVSYFLCYEHLLLSLLGKRTQQAHRNWKVYPLVLSDWISNFDKAKRFATFKFCARLPGHLGVSCFAISIVLAKISFEWLNFESHTSQILRIPESATAIGAEHKGIAFKGASRLMISTAVLSNFRPFHSVPLRI